jgi:hypothetical protein
MFIETPAPGENATLSLLKRTMRDERLDGTIRHLKKAQIFVSAGHGNKTHSAHSSLNYLPQLQKPLIHVQKSGLVIKIPV